MPSIPEDALRFIRALHGDEDAECAFIALHDSDPDQPPRPLFGALDSVWPELAEANAAGYGVFVAINEVVGRRVTENVRSTRTLVADFDFKHDQQPPAEWPARPSMLVESGGGVHAYFFGDVGLERWTAMQKRVASSLGSDPNVGSVTRVMRLPGSMHCKAAPTLVRLRSVSGQTYSAAELDALFPDERISRAAHILSRGWKAGQGHASCLALAGALARASWDVKLVDRFVTDVCVKAGMKGPQNGEVVDTFKRFEDGQRVTGWSTLESLCSKKIVSEAKAALGELCLRQDRPIVWTGADEGRVARDLLRALVDRGETYVRGNTLVYVARHEGELVIHRYTRASLRSRLSDAVTCCRPSATNDDAPVQIAPPDPVVAALVETPTLWEDVPVLQGIASYPVLAPSGAVLDGHGYDTETKLWIDADPVELIPPDECIDVLLEPLCDFPLDKRSQSAVLAAILSAVARPAIRGAVPAFVFDSNSPRTGKKKLADYVALVTIGVAAPVSVQPYEDDELRKRVLALLETGTPLALIDDCKRSIGGGIIDPLLTAWPTYVDRRLGQTELVRVPASTIWMFTGTNVEVRDHTVNRVVTIRLETELEDPSRRSGFRYPKLEQFVSENVEFFRGAALGLLKSWVDAGRPSAGLAPLGSYESWGMIRDVLVWAGMPDPVATVAKRSIEIDGAALLYQEIARLVEDSELGTPMPGGLVGLRTAALIGAAENRWGMRNEVLDEALTFLVSGERTARRVGAALRNLRGRVVDGVMLASGRASDNTSVWYLERV